MSGIPQPELPKPRPRRNVFEKAAATEKTAAVSPPAAEPPIANTSTNVKPEPTRQPGGGVDRSKRPINSKDILLSVPEDLKDRMEATIAFTYPHTGIKHQQAFIRQAIAELCAKLENQHNNGDRYPMPATPPSVN